MGQVSEFCQRRGIKSNIEDAFTAYVRSDYAEKYLLRKEGDTIKMVVNKMTDVEVEQAWRLFVSEMKAMIS